MTVNAFVLRATAGGPSDLNKPELKIRVATPTAMSKASEAIWLLAINIIVCFDIDTHAHASAPQFKGDFV